MERYFFGMMGGCFLTIITVNTAGIIALNTPFTKRTLESEQTGCFLNSRRECQNNKPSPSPVPSPSTSEPVIALKKGTVEGTNLTNGSTSIESNEVLND